MPRLTHTARAQHCTTGPCPPGLPAYGNLRFLHRLPAALAAAARSALAFAAFLLLPALGGNTAHAEVLVSNIGQNDARTVGSLSSHDHAQAFTTGGNLAGYALTSVDIEFAGVLGSAERYAVGIWSSDSEGNPGSSLGTLTGPASLSAYAVNTFTASGSGVALAGNTTYFVVVDSSSLTDNELGNAASEFEDGDKAPGWSIADTSLFRNRDGTGEWQSSADARKIRINGTLAEPVQTPATGTAAISGGDGELHGAERGGRRAHPRRAARRWCWSMTRCWTRARCRRRTRSR